MFVLRSEYMLFRSLAIHPSSVRHTTVLYRNSRESENQVVNSTRWRHFI